MARKFFRPADKVKEPEMSAETPPESAEIKSICRYPVKGLSPQQLESVELTAGQALPYDRAWAIENGGRVFDPENPQHLPKTNFLMLMRDERLATLRTEFDPETGILTVLRNGKQVARGNLNEPIGRALIEQFFAAFMKEELPGAPHIVQSEGHTFSDAPAKLVSVVNRASVRELERVLGKPVDPQRFRANVQIDGIPAWSEFDWADGIVRTSSGIELKLWHRTQRCAATNVNPETGERDMQIPKALSQAFGHTDLGVYLEVVRGGTLRVGETLEPVSA
jgi:hypothetical protein